MHAAVSDAAEADAETEVEAVVDVVSDSGSEDVAGASVPTQRQHVDSLPRCQDLDTWSGYWVSQKRVRLNSLQSIEGLMLVRASMPSPENPNQEHVCTLKRGDIVRVSFDPHPPRKVGNHWWIPIGQEEFVTSNASNNNISNKVSEMMLEAQQRKAQTIRHPLMPH